MDTTIIVTNISTQLKEHQLRELFECCGPILDLKIANAEPLAYAITYASPGHAKAAVFLSGTPLGDREINVALQTSSNLNPVAEPPVGPTAILQQLADNTVQASAAAAAAGSFGGKMVIGNDFGSMTGLGTLSAPLLAAAQKRLDEVARTIYVGNVNCVLSEEELKQFFRTCGQIAHVKMAGETLGNPSRFGFIEFTTIDAAQTALGLTGTVLADLPIKVGKANNPIFKPGSVSLATQKARLEDAMRRVHAATAKITQRVKVGATQQAKSRSKSRDRKKKSRSSERRKKSRSRERKKKSRSRSKSRSRGRRGRRGRRSRSRSRRSRSRGRGRGQRKRKRRSRSKSRSRGRRRNKRSRSRERKRRRSRTKSRSKSSAKSNPPPDNTEKKIQPDRTGQFFNGYCWQPIEAIEANPMNVTMGAPIGMGAVRTLLTQQAGLYAQQQQQHPQQQLQNEEQTEI